MFRRISRASPHEGFANLEKNMTSFRLATVAIATVLVLVAVAFRGVLIEAAYPFERAANAFSRRVLRPISGLFDAVAAKAENDRLKREVESLSMVLSENDSLFAENRKLRSLLRYRDRLRGRWTAAKILSTGGGAGSVGRTVRIDKGSLSGVAKGAAVCVPEGLVGKVVGVTPHTAEVALLPDRAVKVACEIEGLQGTFGVLSGGTDDCLVLDHLSGPSAIPARSRVVTSGRGGVFPKGFAVGYFVEEGRSADGVGRTARIEPAVAFSEIEDVFVRYEE